MNTEFTVIVLVVLFYCMTLFSHSVSIIIVFWKVNSFHIILVLLPIGVYSALNIYLNNHLKISHPIAVSLHWNLLLADRAV